jgi:YfiH family protein
MAKIILPPIDAAFEWRASASGPALICRALERHAAHMFTTRPWRLGSSVSAGDDREGWSEIAQAIGVEPSALIRVRQVHGRAVHLAQKEAEPAVLATADVVLSESRDLAIAVQSADCAPLLIADTRTGAVAAAHAGWRGLAAGVPRTAIAAMSTTFGSRAGDLVVAVGPSIGACCYEVGPDVRDAFTSAGVSGEELARWFHAQPLTPRGHMRLRPQALRPGHVFFDGWRSVRDQCAAAGVPADQIFGSDFCTAGFPELLCSYRRDGAPAGRMAGVVRMRPSA